MLGNMTAPGGWRTADTSGSPRGGGGLSRAHRELTVPEGRGAAGKPLWGPVLGV